MTVPHAAFLDAVDEAEPLTLESAYARARQAALSESAVGAVGLEIEGHLVGLDSAADPVPWPRAAAMLAAARDASGTSMVTLEPGGQLELSGPPAAQLRAAGIAATVARLQEDVRRVSGVLAELRLGVARVGTDPLRPSRRVNPRPRYRAMEEHFAATDRAGAGAVMMNSTAAIQVNLQAGPRRDWGARVARAYRIGPSMVAISACSPWLHGRDTGWKSARQRAWGGLDPRACGAVPGSLASDPAKDAGLDPASAWARFAMGAPVSFVRAAAGGEDVLAMLSPVPFEQWVSGAMRLGGRSPTEADLDTHLTTLFPPVRLRGYLELRYLDMTPARWWPAIAALVTTLMDDPVAADLAAEATEPTAGLWAEAARDGLGDARLAASARRCLAAAASRVPAELRSAVAQLAELIESGRCPGDLLAQHITTIGPQAALEELAHAA
jgi:glutamate--cysteine ligase